MTLRPPVRRRRSVDAQAMDTGQEGTMNEERVDDIPCPWCEATISVPVIGRSRDRLCWSCRMPVRIVDRSRVGGPVRIDRLEERERINRRDPT